MPRRQRLNHMKRLPVAHRPRDEWNDGKQSTERCRLKTFMQPAAIPEQTAENRDEQKYAVGAQQHRQRRRGGQQQEFAQRDRAARVQRGKNSTACVDCQRHREDGEALRQRNGRVGRGKRAEYSNHEGDVPGPLRNTPARKRRQQHTAAQVHRCLKIKHRRIPGAAEYLLH